VPSNVTIPTLQYQRVAARSDMTRFATVRGSWSPARPEASAPAELADSELPRSRYPTAVLSVNRIGWLYDHGTLSGYFTETETNELGFDGNACSGKNDSMI
jgi:hypothetical protein